MKTIPSYALYGETESGQQEWLHWETIQSRSRLHNYQIAPHRHENFCQILHLTGGSGQVTLDGTAIILTAPAVAIVPALTVHAYQFSTDVDGLVITLMERDVREAAELPAQVLADSGEIAEAINRLIEEADRAGPAHALAMRARIALLVVAIQRSPRASEAGGLESGRRSMLHAQAFRLLVDQRFRQTRRIADYADAVGISQTHLNRVCREVLGISALAVVERRVALEARRQLLFSDLPIKQIGAELGYEDPAYFSRMLKRVLGQPPATLRKEHRN